MRVFLIHGYVEDPTIFDELVPLLPPAEYVRIHLADEFARWQPTGPLNVRLLAQYLAKRYRITATDVVIGHSMGGWVAVNVKEVTGAVAIQIGSWTNQKKILFPTDNLTVIKFLVASGFTQSRVLVNYFKKRYRFEESRALYNRLVDGMRHMSRPYLWQQQQTLFAKVPPLTVQPDLRIHARRDNVVRYPDEPYVDVPGDHFCLVCHAEAVAAPICALVANRL